MKKEFKQKIETFGVIPIPPQLKELDRERTMFHFKEVQRGIKCGKENCSCMGQAKDHAQLVGFSKDPRMVKRIFELADIENRVEKFNKEVEVFSKYSI